MTKKSKDIISIILLLTATASLIVFDVLKISYTDDQTLNNLLNGIIPRLITGGALVAELFVLGIKDIMKPDFKKLGKNLLWCIPCFLVVLANFPFTALIGGTAHVERTDLIALFILECLSIGLMEELLFRGLLQDTVDGMFKDKPYGRIYTVVITSAIFGLIHIFNLFAGANAGATILQIGYSFLIGAMLSAVLYKTNNIWLCVLIHAAFDVGGNMVRELGSGSSWDTWFWIFTAVAGVICFLHVVNYLFRPELTKNKKDESLNETTQSSTDETHSVEE